MAEEKRETLPVEVRAQMLQKETSLYFNLAKFEHAQRIAQLFSSSTMVPKHFQGNVANCLIALNYADRLQADPFMVMQNMYIVHGRPGVEAKLVIALINQSGKYSEPVKYRFDGEGDQYGCTAYTREAKSGEMVEGPKITRQMVKNEGWDQDKKNKETGYVQKSKWNTMPEMMFRYRAASYFANVHCPELKLGMSTVEEINDFVELTETHNGKWVPPAVAPPEELPPWCDEILSIVDSSPRFDDFVKSTLQANRSTEAELRKAANSNPAAFIAAYQMWANKQTPEATKPRKPRSDRGVARKAAEPIEPQEPAVNPIPEPEPSSPPEETSEPGDEPNVMTEEMLLDERRAELAELEKNLPNGKYYILEAKKRTGIAHAITVAACDELIRTVHLIRQEKENKH